MVGARAVQSVAEQNLELLKWRLQAVLVSSDLLGAALAVALAYVARPFTVAGWSPWETQAVLLGVLGPCWLIALFLGGMYTLRPPRSDFMWAQRIARRTVVGTLLAIALSFLIHPALLGGRLFYVLATLVAGVLFWLARLVSVHYGPDPLVRERVLVVGTGKHARSLIEALTNGHNPNRAQLVGAIRADAEETPGADLLCEYLGDLEDSFEAIRHRAVNHVVITPPPPLSRDLTHFAAHCDALGLRVQTLENAYEELTWRAPIFSVGQAWQASLETRSSSKYATRFKRLADLGLTILFMPLTLGVIGVCAVLIKLFSPGPVFYRQERIGKNGIPFTFTKLRTMVVDAEKNTGPVWATADDPRVTPVGRFMRKTRLDEVPQLFSVLRGDMSLIGPRPERAHFVDVFREEIPFYEKRLMVPPGITGWAQIHHNYDRSTDDVIEKLRYDLYYIRHLSFSLDLHIIIKTAGVMLGKRGAH